VFVGTPEGQEAAHVEACLEHGSNTVLMGGANRSELPNGMIAKDIDIPNKNDYGRKFFIGLANLSDSEGCSKADSMHQLQYCSMPDRLGCPSPWSQSSARKPR
jgi:hypothetical protein